jgi:hypothetical protein
LSVHREIELYAKAGMSHMDAIRAATAVPARSMGLEREVGTVETGKQGDLLVLDANPLDDISNIRTVRLVMKGGRVYESAALWRVAGFGSGDGRRQTVDGGRWTDGRWQGSWPALVGLVWLAIGEVWVFSCACARDASAAMGGEPDILSGARGAILAAECASQRRDCSGATRVI